MREAKLVFLDIDTQVDFMLPTGASSDEVIAHSDNGLIHVPSRYSLAESGKRLEAAVQAHGLRLFARIDHAAAAAGAGLAMPPAEVFLIGNPALGTPLMLAAPTLAIRGGRAVGTVGQVDAAGREIHAVAARPRQTMRR